MDIRGDDRGQVIVEFAFALPILALIILMIVDVGLVVREHQVIQNAAREGARFSCLPEYRKGAYADPTLVENAIKTRVVDYCAQENVAINLGDVVVDQNYPIDGGIAIGSQVTVTSNNRQMLLVGLPLLPTNTMSITARAVMRNLY